MDFRRKRILLKPNYTNWPGDSEMGIPISLCSIIYSEFSKNEELKEVD